MAAATNLLADPQAMRRMGAAAAQHIRTGFSFSQQVDDTIALYRRLIDGRNGAAAPVPTSSTSRDDVAQRLATASS